MDKQSITKNTSQHTREAAILFKALANETRMYILTLLSEGEQPVQEIEYLTGLSQPIVSQYLARLRADGLVKTRREGRTIYYALEHNKLNRVKHNFEQLFCQQVKNMQHKQAAE